MKKVILIVALLVIAGGGYFAYQAATNDTGGEEQALQRKGGLVVKDDDSLLGWLKRGKDVDCLVTTAEGEDIIILAKGDKVRIDGTPGMFGPSTDGSDWIMVTTDEWMYMWSGNEGTKINLKAVESLAAETAAEEAERYSWEKAAAEWESSGAAVKCKEAKLSDNLFLPPANVQFTDMTAMLESMGQMRESLPDLPELPAGELGSGETAEDVELDIDLDELMRSIEGMEAAE